MTGDAVPPEGSRVRVVRLDPGLARYLRDVRRRLAGPRPRVAAAVAELRAGIEGQAAGAAGAEDAVAFAGSPGEAAARLAGEHGLGLRALGVWWKRAAAAAAGAALLVAAGALARRADLRWRPLGAALVGAVPAGGVRAGAEAAVAADLRGDGSPLLVGAHLDGGRAWLVAWSLQPSGQAVPLSALALPGQGPVPQAPLLAVGSFAPGSPVQLAVAEPPAASGGAGTLLLVGWRDGGLALVGRTGLALRPAALAALPPTGAGQDDLFVAGRAGGAWTLDRFAPAGGGIGFAAAGSVPLPVQPAGAADFGLAGGVAGGRAYLLFGSSGAGPGGPCADGQAGIPAVVDAQSLRPVWQGTAAAGTLAPVPTSAPGAPPGPLEAQGYAPAAGGPPAASPVLRWAGSAWTVAGRATCSVRLVGAAPAAAPPGVGWVGLDGYNLIWTSPDGRQTGGGHWPFDGPLLDFQAPGSLILDGSDLIRFDPSTLQVARWQGSAVIARWQGFDSTTVAPSGWLPDPAGGWSFVDGLGNLYSPQGRLWAWRGASVHDVGSVDWVRLTGGEQGWSLTGPASSWLQLQTPAGAAGAVAPIGPGAGRAGTVDVFPLPDGRGTRADLGVLKQPGTPAAELLVYLAGAGPILQLRGRLALPGARLRAVLPGPGGSEVLLDAGEGTVGLLWDGRTLRRAGAAGAAGLRARLPAGTTAVLAAGRWLAAGLRPQAGTAGPGLVLARLGAGGSLRERTVPLPFGRGAGAGPDALLAVPDGSGRVLVSLSGQTLVLALH